MGGWVGGGGEERDYFRHGNKLADWLGVSIENKDNSDAIFLGHWGKEMD
jgi:hypothetical protein